MKTLGEVLSLTSQFLKEKKCSRSRRIAEELIAHVLKLKRLDLYMQFDRPFQEAELVLLRTLLRRASQHEPVEYIIGELNFYHCSLFVTKDVLIPRPETEILVDQACQAFKQSPYQGKVLWDLCTGSGCMGLAVKKACPELTVCLSDISPQALAVAEKNAQKNGIEVEILQGDLCAPFQGRKADFIFCNPPYISSQEMTTLDPSVKNFEPQIALDGGKEGLAFYRRLKEELPLYLNHGAKIFFEIGAEQGQAVSALFSESYWKNKRVEKDWSDHDRFFFLEFE